jgi:hypothetical protein
MDEKTISHITNIADADYELGKIVAMEEISTNLLKRAMSYFERKDDKNAILIRDLSTDIERDAITLRRIYDEKTKKKRDNSWEILNNCVGNIDYSKIGD